MTYTHKFDDDGTPAAFRETCHLNRQTTRPMSIKSRQGISTGDRKHVVPITLAKEPWKDE